MPSAQLLTKQVIGADLDAAGVISNVRFNLQRGKIARVWGFNWNLSGIPQSNIEYSMFVRKTGGGDRVTTPQDILWASLHELLNGAASAHWEHIDRNIMFPKPHRTTGLTVQMHATSNTTSRGLLVIYYDIDDVEKGELVQRWEKNISKGRTRRTIAP